MAFKNDDYHEAYFTFRDIIEINPYLTDINIYYTEAKNELIKNNILQSEVDEIKDLFVRVAPATGTTPTCWFRPITTSVKWSTHSRVSVSKTTRLSSLPRTTVRRTPKTAVA